MLEFSVTYLTDNVYECPLSQSAEDIWKKLMCMICNTCKKSVVMTISRSRNYSANFEFKAKAKALHLLV